MLVNKVVKERIAYVKMQNGKHFNCLSEDMCNELMEAIRASYTEECVGIVLQAKQCLRADAVRAGILDQAERSAESTLRRLFASMGFREVVFTFRKQYPLRPDSAGR